MGRYYSGDIEGKFWFGVQDSSDADFFGVIGREPNYLEYEFGKENLKDIKKGIKACKKELGGYKKKLDDFFDRESGYNDSMVAKALGVSESRAKHLLMWYARLELGEKILDSVEKVGQCHFEAEL